MSKALVILNTTLLIAALILAMLVIRTPAANVSADSGRFDYVHVISPVYLYQGNQSVLVLDKRNGNIWFFGKGDEMQVTFRDPVLVTRLALEKLDQ